jgi:hypothetical protein
MRLIVRSAAAVTAGLLMVTTAATSSSAASPAASSGDWLAKQISGGVVTGQYGPDYGLTADTALAIKRIGGHRKALVKSRRALAAHVNSWITGADFGAPHDVYAGSVAKAAVAARTLGANPRSFGGVNLVRRLNAQVTASGPAKGRIHDTSSFGDYANTVGQAYAAQALSAARSPKARSVVRFLLAQQCAKGYFRLNLNPDPTAAAQGCVAGDAVGSAPDTDATALAVLSLQTIRHPGAKVRVALRKATRWLARTQHGNGSFGGGPTTSTPNANSTGLAGAALAGAGACRPARKAARWVERLQVGRVSGALARERGAIAYDRAALTVAQTAGITAANQDQWRRATAQAAPVLRFLRGC